MRTRKPAPKRLGVQALSAEQWIILRLVRKTLRYSASLRPDSDVMRTVEYLTKTVHMKDLEDAITLLRMEEEGKSPLHGVRATQGQRP